MIKIAHLTSAHPRYDIRIFAKECASLARSGRYDVHLVVADGKGDERREGIAIHDVGASAGRWKRMTRTTRQVLNKAVELDARLYHLHDPELLPVGLRLKAMGKHVVFDAHEDVPKQLLGKPYLSTHSKKLLSRMFALFERYACRRFDCIVSATPVIRDKFLTIHPCGVDINNFPIPGELETRSNDVAKRNEVVYVGGISEIRGIREMVEALPQSGDVRLNLAGRFNHSRIEREVRELPGWERVNALGHLDRDGVRELLARSRAGLVLFHPLPNHIDAQPNKMFEYMSAGLPIVTSDFPLWKAIVEGNRCGLCVDPMDPAAIAEAIRRVVENPDEAEAMGRRGSEAVRTRYNWSVEEQKLLELYRKLIP